MGSKVCGTVILLNIFFCSSDFWPEPDLIEEEEEETEEVDEKGEEKGGEEEKEDNKWQILSVVGGQASTTSSRDDGPVNNRQSSYSMPVITSWPQQLERSLDYDNTSSSKSNNNTCDLCSKEFVYGIALKRHIVKEHGGHHHSDYVIKGVHHRDDVIKGVHHSDDDVIKQDPDGGAPLHICSSCGKAFASLDYFASHTRLCSRIINLKETTQGKNCSQIIKYADNT